MKTWTNTCGLPLLFNFEPHPCVKIGGPQKCGLRVSSQFPFTASPQNQLQSLIGGLEPSDPLGSALSCVSPLSRSKVARITTRGQTSEPEIEQCLPPDLRGWRFGHPMSFSFSAVYFSRGTLPTKKGRPRYHGSTRLMVDLYHLP